jgi:2-hydroxychromene-2-carboxylate isomerase
LKGEFRDMAAPLEFYFDFSSPYGFVGAEKIDALGQKYGRTVNWHPILLGVVFKTTGSRPLPQLPLKGDYALRDFVRTAGFFGVKLAMPTPFPISTQAASRAFYWAADQDVARAKALALAFLRAFFVQGRDISKVDVLGDVAAAQGWDRVAMLAAIETPEIKDRLRRETEEAIAKGVFGSPYVLVDGEPFWGVDRFDHIERWLKDGPW